MGIVNVTPDSFFDGGQHNSLQQALELASDMVKSGVDIIDVGGYSSRPGAEDISIEEEIKRTQHVIKEMRERFPQLLISIDTFRSEVAQKAIEAGADMINDISGGAIDPQILAVAAQCKVPYILMHMKGTPQTMREQASYENLVGDILDYFTTRIALARKAGVTDIIIDPGFGFAKTMDQNYELLRKLDVFKILNVPVLVGVSRKSMIYKILDNTAAEALNGTTVLNAIALMNRINILRVHDVKEARETITLVKRVLN
ncbi:MAG: dihydropteroate synthase [Cytophagales bacterium]|nr:dihydropteroate synthase [Cytophaga sp.]